MLSLPDPEPLAMKVFKPKFGLPVLNNYKSPAPKSFWEIFPHGSNLQMKSLVCLVRLRQLAIELDCANHPSLKKICEDIGCRGTFRQSSTSTNAPSAYKFGPEVTDAIAEWVTQGFAARPINTADRPANAKVSGIMCRKTEQFHMSNIEFFLSRWLMC